MSMLSYEEFGRRFFEVAVTEERVAAALAPITGDSFEVGPIPSGPRGIARVSARVDIDDLRITREIGDLITFTVDIPLAIGLHVDLRVDSVVYDVRGLVTLPMVVHAAEPLMLRIDVDPPSPGDVIVGVSSRNLRGEIIRMVAQVDDEIRRFIAAHVAEQISSPETQQARIIDVAAELGRAFESM
ncbi:hypothetical protein ACWDTD_10490 [Gordonia sp. NPDC003425]